MNGIYTETIQGISMKMIKCFYLTSDFINKVHHNEYKDSLLINPVNYLLTLGAHSRLTNTFYLVFFAGHLPIADRHSACGSTASGKRFLRHHRIHK